MSGAPWVAMRSRNDMPLVERTLASLAAQRAPHSLLVLDNASTDGTRDAAARHADKLVDVPEGAYVPGRVLNSAMRETDGDVVVFLNSDCEPLGPDWLGNLLAGMADPDVAAAFGRQEPRPGCAPLMAKDTVMTFGDGSRQARWRHCFSMAASCVRRSVWEGMPFSESLRYSEDIDWTWRARRAGWGVRYVPDAAVLHSHNYSLAQLAKRQFGEGWADAEIFEWERERAGALRYSVLPWGRLVASDVAWCVPRMEVGAALSSPVVRAVMAKGRRAGFSRARRDIAARRREAAVRNIGDASRLPFAPLGSKAFNERLGKTLEGIAARLSEASRGALAGLVLCGGYGRGEGAVVAAPDGGEFAWNDVDLVPVARPGCLPALKDALRGTEAVREAFRAEFRAELDFGRALDEAAIRALPPVLLWLETARGHRVIGGESDLFSRNVSFDPAQSPPPVEGEKLLLNRGAGLLMAFAKACGRPVAAYDSLDPAFTRRNAAKCRLALGDALLMAAGRYETLVSGKAAAFAGAERALRRLLGADADSFPAIAVQYSSGLAFKAEPGRHPEEPSAGELSTLARLWILCFGVLESVRSGKPWPEPAAFAQTTRPVESSENRGARVLLRNVAQNLRLGRLSLRYPRERLFRELPLLLDEVAAARLPDSVRTEAFVGLWNRYN